MQDISQALKMITERTLVITEAARLGLDKHTDNVLELSNVYCPKDTGKLVASGKKEVTKDSPLSKTIRISYGGDDAPYAFWVHERLDLHHNSPTCAKFLERAVTEKQADLIETVRSAGL